MFSLPVHASADEAIVATYRALLAHGAPAQPRGLGTLELVPYGFVLTDARARCPTLPARKWSFALALGEWCWHLHASTDLATIAWYAQRWRSFSDNGRTIDGSCYGQRIFSTDAQGRSQWSAMLDTLRRDPMSRRAVLSLGGDFAALAGETLDASCVLSLQFLIRDGALDLIASLRSNDVHHGLPYDLFLFTMLQELAAVTLGVPPGRYIHLAGSMHVYEAHLAVCRELAESTLPPPQCMAPMSDIDAIGEFLAIEGRLRDGERPDLGSLPPYWRKLAEVLEWFADAKRGAGTAPREPFYARLVAQGPKPRRSGRS